MLVGILLELIGPQPNDLVAPDTGVKRLYLAESEPMPNSRRHF
jgi:hypothetical protein